MNAIIKLIEAAGLPYERRGKVLSVKLGGWQQHLVINIHTLLWSMFEEQGSGEKYQCEFIARGNLDDLSPIEKELAKVTVANK